MSWEPWTAFGYHGGWRTVRCCGPIDLVLERRADGQYQSWVQGHPTRLYPTAALALAAGHRNLNARLRRWMREAQAALDSPLEAPPPWPEEETHG